MEPATNRGWLRDPRSLAILSRTLVPSPVIKKIYSARIRQADQNDVVFIRETSVEIRKYVNDKCLEDVAFKSDFDCKIRASSILTCRGQAEVANQDFSRRSTSAAHFLPPQMLALALQKETEDFIEFLYCYHDQRNRVQFASSIHPLPGDLNIALRLGEHIATDPFSRILTVAAQAGRFIIYRLKPASRIQHRDEVSDVGHDNMNDFEPVDEEHHVKVDGMIRQMGFLQPPTEDLSLIILVLIVSNEKRLIQYTYQWEDSEKPLRQIVLNPQKQLLSPELVNPLLLIPMNIAPGFLLVCEQQLGIFPNVILNTIPRCKDLCIPNDARWEAVDDPSNSAKAPLHTSWARPFRHNQYTTGKRDAIYLCREDGLIRLLEIESSPIPDMGIEVLTNPLGYLGVNVNSGFAIIDFGQDADFPGTPQPRVSSDVLLVGGNMSEGGLFLFRPREELTLWQNISNWSGIRDYATVPGSDKPCRVFACTGRGRKHGALCEIRYGVEAQTFIELRHSDPTCIGIWLILGLSGEEPQLLLSTVTSSCLCTLGQQTQDGEEESWTYPIDRESRTLAAASTSADLVIQVTESSVRAFPNTNPVGQGEVFEEVREPLSITLAAIESSASSVLYVVQDINSFVLTHLGLNRVNSVISSGQRISWKLDSEPSCVHIQSILGNLLAFIGVRNGTILVYQISEERLRPLGQVSLEDSDAICESILVLRRSRATDDTSHGSILLCGLRSGTLKAYDFLLDPEEVLISECLENFVLGTTAVTIPSPCSAPDNGGQLMNAAVLACENICYLITYAGDSPTTKADLRRVWFTDSKGQGLYQPPVLASSQISSWNTMQSPNESVYSIICVTRKKVRALCIRLNIGPRIVPWRITLNGNPSRVVYSSRFRRLFVGLSYNAVMDPTIYFKTPRDNGRVSFSAIKIIDPDDPNTGDGLIKREEVYEVLSHLPPEKSSFAAIVGKSGERITGLGEWSFVSGNNTWPILLVSTLRETTVAPLGRIRMFSILSRHVNLEIKEQHVFREPKEVYAVAGFNDSAFVYCSGAKLFLRYLGSDGDRIRDLATLEADIGSPGRSISVQGHFIYVSTLEHSLKVFHLRQETLNLVFSDGKARISLDHLLLNGPFSQPLIMTANLDGKVCGLMQPLQATISGEMPLIFEANLPSIISCFHEATLQPCLRSSSSTVPPPMLASALDGTFYRLDLIDAKDWELLRLVQDMAEKDKYLCPYTWRENRERMLPNEYADPRRRHLNGDILLRILQLGSEAHQKLESLVRSQSQRESGDYRQRLLRLAKDAIGPDFDQGAWIETILRHIELLLKAPL